MKTVTLPRTFNLVLDFAEANVSTHMSLKYLSIAIPKA